MDTMASDSESSHAGTHSQGLSPMPGLPEGRPSQRTENLSMGGMLSPGSARRKTAVKGEFPGVMKRAVSSPNVRDLANLDTSAMSSAEKKRNKLGYHRTAVACVHCRRRKIRCIIATDNTSTRCNNCIRLKKDCQFYPVDQQPTPGKTRSSSKADDSMGESPTPETSPAIVGTPWDPSEAYVHGHFQPSAVAPNSAGNFSFSGPMPHSDTSGISSAPFSSSNTYPHSPWSSTPVLNSPFHSMEPGQFDTSHATHWHQPGHPASSGYEYSPYPPSATQTPLQSSTQEHFPHFSGKPHSMPLMPYHPVRSMSLATPNDLLNYHSPYHTDSHMFLPRLPTNTSEIHPPSLSSNTIPTPPSSDSHSTPSAYVYGDHAQINPSYHSGPPVPSPLMAVSSSETFGGAWYNAPTGLADVKEEEEMANMHLHHQHPHPMSARFRQNPG